MEMYRTKSEFDYQSIIVACEIQDVNIQKAFDNKNEVVIELQEQFNILKDLSKEMSQKKDILAKLKFTLNKNLQKVHKICDKSSILSEEQKIVQAGISQVKLGEKSNDFVKKILDMDDELKTLYSQLEEETLKKLLSDVNIELLTIRDAETQLESTFEEVKLSSNDLGVYDRVNVLKNMFGHVLDQRQIFEDIDKKLANKKRNIQFLTAECNKKLSLLQTLS